MTSLENIREEIRLKLTGDLLEIELEDDTIDQIVMTAVRELQRYITVTRLITVPFERCIDLCQYDYISNVVAIYRTDELGSTTTDSSGSYDPMQVAQWQLISGMGNIKYFQDAVYNYASWTTLQQLRQTLSTDLAFRYDKHSRKLYINTSVGTPRNITIEYIPIIKQVEDIKSEYWEDMLILLQDTCRLSLHYLH